VSQVAKSDGVKPEYVVQCVVQTERDEQSVEECIETSSDSSQVCNSFAQHNQSCEDDRPYEQKNY